MRDWTVTRLGGAYFIWRNARTCFCLALLHHQSKLRVRCCLHLAARTLPRHFHHGSAPSPSPQHLPFLVFPSPRKVHHRPCTTRPQTAVPTSASLPGATISFHRLPSPSTSPPPPSTTRKFLRPPRFITGKLPLPPRWSVSPQLPASSVSSRNLTQLCAPSPCTV